MDHDEDSYPHFGSTLASQSAGAAAASWNPAFRENRDAVDDDDDFFERYPGATAKKSAEVTESIMVEERQEPESPLRRSSVRIRREVNVARSEATPDELERVPSNHVEAEGPISQGIYEEDDDEALLRDREVPILSPNETAQQQEEALEEQMPDDYTRDVESDEQIDDADLESPAEHYDHQGEVTEMEEAQEPSVEASLLENEEPLPTTGLLSREPTMGMQSGESTLGLDGPPVRRQPSLKAQPAVSQLSRAFTTDFSESPIEPTHAHSRSIPDEWPSVGDDRTFGELLDNQNPQPVRAEREVLEGSAARESERMAAPDLDLLSEDEGEIKEVDLAAAWGAALDDDEMLAETPTDHLDPSQFFGEDDDGFLEDEPPAPAPVPNQPPQPQVSASTTQYRPTNLQPVTPQQIQPGVPSPQFFNQGAHGRSAGTPSTGLYDVHNQYTSTYQSQPPPRPAIIQQQGHSQSFADKSKGGYQSPYDLPMEVVKPRRRPVPQQPTPAQTPGRAPPRSSSIGSQTGQQPPFSQLSGAPSQPPSVSSLSPPNSRGSGGSARGPIPGTVKSPPKTATGSGFFEELPMTSKPRARPTVASTAQTMPSVPTLSSLPMSPPRGPQNAYQQAPPGPTSPQRAPGPPQQLYQQFAAAIPSQPGTGALGGLRQPERMPLLPDQPPSLPPQQRQQPPAQQGPPANARYSPQSNMSAPAPPPPLPAAQNRYSPAPTATTTSQPPAGTARYSPAPSAQPTQAKPRQPSAPGNTLSGMQQVNPFAPRTSSPLAAYTDKPHPPLPAAEPAPPQRAMPPTSPPKVNGIRRSPPESSIPSKYSPVESRAIDPSHQFGPPLPRPRTQSPETTMKMQKSARPTSAGITSAPPEAAVRPKGPVLPHRRRSTRKLTFAAPQDERSLDPLLRWKGHPIFKWGASGIVLSSFPKHTPFYAAGQGAPSVKCTPGSISVQDASQFMPMDERNAKFPGPLTARSKGRKKDVLAWMAGKIEDLERVTERAMMDFSLPAELKKAEEKLVLWRVMRIFVENDGVLEGNSKIEEEVRKVLLPNLPQMAQVSELQSPGSATVQRDAVDKSITLQLRQALLEGQRDRAVWLAEEKRLWGHAMLIASTMGPETWKQIVQAFVRNQVKSFGSDARSLAALYHVFAGNSEECVDELVPPSARAGFQMISMTDGSVSGNPLEGLDQWRETLDLVTSNRTANDAASIISLGKLLAGYGRVEAAHTCYLFAKAFVKHSGADDAEAHFVLLGANHQATDESFGSDLDSILLTEIYEYAISLSAPSTAGSYIPYLQAFKLLHAQELAARGLKTKAQSYCDAITSAYTSTTRPSPYYHPVFTQAVADMNAFLSQTPHDAKAGLFSRPAMNKVSSSASSWFTKFVSGEEDQESTDSGPGGAGGDGMGGPFGGVSGDSGSISRSASGTDLYNPMMVGLPTPGASQMFGPSSTPARYTPGGQAGTMKYGPAQSYGTSGVPPSEPQRSVSSRYAPPPSAGSNLGVPTGLSRKASDQSLPYAPSSRRDSTHDTSSQGSYEPRPILADDGSAYGYSPMVHSQPTHSPAVSSPLVLAQHAPAVQEPEDTFGPTDGIPAPLRAEESETDEETGGGYIPPTGGYEPPSYSYQPYEPEPESPEEAKPKRRTFGDEDDYGAETEKPPTAAKKAQADREADELVRKAAEADAARDKEKAVQKKGWFGGWFGGSRDATASPGPIKAKLGEENSFYYDENLKKWVNKKAGPEAATSAAPTPPPPKGPASRVASESMGPPSGPPSRNSSGSGLASMNMNRPPTSGSGVAPSGPSSGPPSRSDTPASYPPSESGAPPLTAPTLNGSSLGLPSAGTARPSSSLSNASSIDDLLAGPPSARKGGTVKGKKKGRYVDVMAK